MAASNACGGTVMRIHEGNFAYDIELPRDPQTQLALNWRFTVYRLRPAEQVVSKGEAPTRTEAEKKAKGVVTRLNAKERELVA
jgi:hypothetical protein